MGLTNLLVTLLGSCGLIYLGGHIIGNKMLQMTGYKFRNFIFRQTKNPWAAGFWGFTFNSFFNTMTLILFTVGGLLVSGILSFKQAYPMLIWANVGDVSYLYLASLDMKIVALFILGISGILYAFARNHKLLLIVELFTGIGFLLLGISLTKIDFHNTDFEKEISAFLLTSKNFNFMTVLVGIILRMVLQSSFFPLLLSMNLYSLQLIDIKQAALLQAGLALGKATSIALFSFYFKDEGKHLIVLEVLYSLLHACLLFLIITGTFFYHPLLLSLLTSISTNPNLQIANLLFIFTCLAGLLMTIFEKPIIRFIQRVFPVPAKTEDFSRPAYIQASIAESDPGIAFELLYKEHIRFSERLLEFSKLLESSVFEKKTLIDNKMHFEFVILGRRIFTFLNHFLSQPQLSPGILKALMDRINMQTMLMSIESYLFNLSCLYNDFKIYKKKGVYELFIIIVESLDFFCLTLVDVLKSRDPGLLEKLIEMSSEKEPVLKEIRERFFLTARLSREEKQVIFDLSMLFAQTTSLIHQLALLQEKISEH